jgi:hypothetical protein
MIYYFFVFSCHYVFDVLTQLSGDRVEQVELLACNLLGRIDKPMAAVWPSEDTDGAKIQVAV